MEVRDLPALPLGEPVETDHSRSTETFYEPGSNSLPINRGVGAVLNGKGQCQAVAGQLGGFDRHEKIGIPTGGVLSPSFALLPLGLGSGWCWGFDVHLAAVG